MNPVLAQKRLCGVHDDTFVVFLQEFGCLMSAKLDGLNELQLTNHTKLKTDLLRNLDSVNENLSDVKIWSQDTSILLQRNSQIVEEFLDKDLQKDVPTGE